MSVIIVSNARALVEETMDETFDEIIEGVKKCYDCLEAVCSADCTTKCKNVLFPATVNHATIVVDCFNCLKDECMSCVKTDENSHGPCVLVS